MSAHMRLDFSTRQLEADGSVLGRFVPQSATEGALDLEGAHYTYIVRPHTYGHRIILYRAKQQIAAIHQDFHDGVFTLRVGDDVTFDLHDDILYCDKGVAGKVSFDENGLTMDLNALVPAASLGLVAALVALDTMWANLVGFTRRRPPSNK
jgi:hypothetical protein